MQCPHCNKKVSFFSREMNRFGKVKACPNCGGSVRLRMNLKVIALWFFPAVILTILIKPLLGAFNSLPGVMLLFFLGARLEPTNVSPVSSNN